MSKLLRHLLVLIGAFAIVMAFVWAIAWCFDFPITLKQTLGVFLSVIFIEICFCYQGGDKNA